MVSTRFRPLDVAPSTSRSATRQLSRPLPLSSTFCHLSGVRSQRAPNPWMASRSALNVASGALNSNAPDATPKRPAPVVTGVAAVRRDLVVVVREGLRVGDGAARVVVLVRCVGRIVVDAALVVVVARGAFRITAAPSSGTTSTPAAAAATERTAARDLRPLLFTGLTGLISIRE